MSKEEKEQSQGCIPEINFGYNTSSEDYLQITADMNELGDISVTHDRTGGINYV